MSELTVNKEFIVSKLKEKGQAMKDLARGLKIDPTGLSKRIQGHREFTAKEAVDLANYLGVPIDITLKSIGLETPPAGDSAIFAVARVDENQVIHDLNRSEITDILHKDPEAVVVKLETGRSSDLNAKMLAGTRIVTLSLDGTIRPECLGKMSFVVEKGTKNVYIGRIMYGSRGFMVYSGLMTVDREIQIESASPVIAIYP